VRLHIAPDGNQALRFVRRAGAIRSAPRPTLILLELHLRHAAELGLNAYQFTKGMRDPIRQQKVIYDVDSADLSGVSGTPKFFINGRRHYGAYDIDALSTAVRAAKARAIISSPS
jgi:predicted DsbA family dithiol-disulfide isomerase